jgi:predicted nucleic acid-binding protein
VSSGPAAPGARTIVLDANILIRAALGRRVLSLIERYADRVRFLAPDEAFADARAYVPEILVQRSIPEEASAPFLDILERLSLLVTSMPTEAYADLEAEARLRLKGRDEEDWPFVALALKLGCPVWTEDEDFFGSGVATWTTDRVELYLGG